MGMRGKKTKNRMAKKKKVDKGNKDFTKISIDSFFRPESSYLDMSLSQVNLIFYCRRY